jgi:hypothetical protein
MKNDFFDSELVFVEVEVLVTDTGLVTEVGIEIERGAESGIKELTLRVPMSYDSVSPSWTLGRTHHF